jgi:hypothetical protein
MYNRVYYFPLSICLTFFHSHFNVALLTPNTLLTKIKSRCHENTVKCDERTNLVVYFECWDFRSQCQAKCEIPLEFVSSFEYQPPTRTINQVQHYPIHLSDYLSLTSMLLYLRQILSLPRSYPGAMKMP